MHSYSTRSCTRAADPHGGGGGSLIPGPHPPVTDQLTSGGTYQEREGSQGYVAGNVATPLPVCAPEVTPSCW